MTRWMTRSRMKRASSMVRSRELAGLAGLVSHARPSRALASRDALRGSRAHASVGDRLGAGRVAARAVWSADPRWHRIMVDVDPRARAPAHRRGDPAAGRATRSCDVRRLHARAGRRARRAAARARAPRRGGSLRQGVLQRLWFLPRSRSRSSSAFSHEYSEASRDGEPSPRCSAATMARPSVRSRCVAARTGASRFLRC